VDVDLYMYSKDILPEPPIANTDTAVRGRKASVFSAHCIFNDA